MPSSPDPFHLQRFVDAQASIYPQALAELRAGAKRTHWMWFIFPQLAGLGSSPTAQRFAIRSMDEAVAYLAHPILGPRLLDCTAAVSAVANRTAGEIFSYPDDLKFHSSLTLFAVAAPEQAHFRLALDRFFAGKRDGATLDLLGTTS